MLICRNAEAMHMDRESLEPLVPTMIRDSALSSTKYSKWFRWWWFEDRMVQVV